MSKRDIVDWHTVASHHWKTRCILYLWDTSMGHIGHYARHVLNILEELTSRHQRKSNIQSYNDYYSLNMSKDIIQQIKKIYEPSHDKKNCIIPVIKIKYNWVGGEMK